jgi:hypothetical protein
MKFITYLAPAVAALAIATPASAQLSAREDRLFKAGYEYGYNYGMLAETCVQFMFGHVSEEMLARSARYVRDNEDLKPYFKKKIAQNFADMARDNDDSGVCNPVVQSVFKADTQPSNGYRRADNWY